MIGWTSYTNRTAIDSFVRWVIHVGLTFERAVVLHWPSAMFHWHGLQEAHLVSEKRTLERRVAELRLVSTPMTFLQFVVLISCVAADVLSFLYHRLTISSSRASWMQRQRPYRTGRMYSKKIFAWLMRYRFCSFWINLWLFQQMHSTWNQFVFLTMVGCS